MLAVSLILVLLKLLLLLFLFIGVEDKYVMHLALILWGKHIFIMLEYC